MPFCDGLGNRAFLFNQSLRLFETMFLRDHRDDSIVAARQFAGGCVEFDELAGRGRSHQR